MSAKGSKKPAPAAEQRSSGVAQAKAKGQPEKGPEILPGGEAAVPAPKDILEGFAKSTSRVVQQAASILEEEIAAGIVAAQQIQRRFMNVEAVRAGNPEDVMQRFRCDLHHLVDLGLDVIHAAARSVSDLAQRAVRVQVRDASGKPTRKGADNIPTLAPSEPLKAGESGELTMSVENDSDTLTADFSFNSSDLVNAASGARIPATEVRFIPERLALQPHGGESVKISFNIPPKTVAGKYAGLIQSTNLNPQICAVLSVQIT